MHALEAIINGTTNYILTDMATGRDYAPGARRGAAPRLRRGRPAERRRGHRRRLQAGDPRDARLPRRGPPDATSSTSASPSFTRTTSSYAAEMGYVIKLIAWARLVDGQIEAAVYPMLDPGDAPAGGGQGRLQRDPPRRRPDRQADALRPRRRQQADRVGRRRRPLPRRPQRRPRRHRPSRHRPARETTDSAVRRAQLAVLPPDAGRRPARRPRADRPGPRREPDQHRVGDPARAARRG